MKQIFLRAPQIFCAIFFLSLLPSFADVDVFFSPQGGCKHAIISRIDHAQASVWVEAYGLTNDEIALALARARHRGLDVRVIIDGRHKTLAKIWPILAANGIAVFADSLHATAHNKVILIDTVVVITGSYNFTDAAELRNAENLLVITDRSIATSFKTNFLFHLGHSAPLPGP